MGARFLPSTDWDMRPAPRFWGASCVPAPRPTAQQWCSWVSWNWSNGLEWDIILVYDYLWLFDIICRCRCNKSGWWGGGPHCPVKQNRINMLNPDGLTRPDIYYIKLVYKWNCSEHYDVESSLIYKSLRCRSLEPNGQTVLHLLKQCMSSAKPNCGLQARQKGILLQSDNQLSWIWSISTFNIYHNIYIYINYMSNRQNYSNNLVFA